MARTPNLKLLEVALRTLHTLAEKEICNPLLWKWRHQLFASMHYFASSLMKCPLSSMALTYGALINWTQCFERHFMQKFRLPRKKLFAIASTTRNKIKIPAHEAGSNFLEILLQTNITSEINDGDGLLCLPVGSQPTTTVCVSVLSFFLEIALWI